MNFQLFDYLQSLNINYKTESKNVGEGWIGLEDCPVCGDKRYHFGINRETGNFNCWVCGTTGNLYRLIHLLEEIPYEKIKERIESFSLQNSSNSLKDIIENIFKKLEENNEKIITYNGKLPSFLIPINEACLRYNTCWYYLVSRGFEEKDWEKWDAYYCFDGKFRWRIVFPIKLHKKLVGYVSRAIIPHQKRYLNNSKHEFPISLKDCLYNYDNITIGDEIIITEGIFDALKTEKLTGMKTVALLGKELSSGQKILLMEKKPSKIWILLDRDAWVESLKIKNELNELLSCQVIPLLTSSKDPAEDENLRELLNNKEVF